MKNWQPGEIAALRGISGGRFWSARSTIVIHDQPDELALLLLPGAECAAPWGYVHQKHGDHSRWDRWGDELSRSWSVDKYNWQTKRCLILMTPGSVYSILLMWEHVNNKFLGYYVNFEIPYTRSLPGFDTHDLELDMVIDPSLAWQWKDQEEYRQGVELGMIKPEIQAEIKQAELQILEKLKKQEYPFDHSWLDVDLNISQRAPGLPAGWDS